MRRSDWRKVTFFILLGFLIWTLSSPSPILGEDKKEESEKRPERLVQMAVEYPGVEVLAGENVSMEIILYNKGRSEEYVDLWIASQPKDWKAKLKTYRFEVRGVHVPSGKDKTITFEAEPDKNVKPGEYRFEIKGQTPDAKFKMAQAIVVTVKEKEKGAKEAKGVKLTTSYPVLRGPSDAKFEFSMEVESQLDKEAVFDLLAQGPEGWEINFKPSYEDKYFSSLRLKEKQSQTVAVSVKPSPAAKAGEYPINVKVSSKEARAEAKLTVVLTGTYKIDAGTPTGVLSLEAIAGKPANFSVFVKNTGSAINRNITFSSFKPENWEVTFKPEKIDALEPNAMQQVEVTVKPASQALVGDYSVGVLVNGEKAEKTVEMRVTVKASTAWGWIGIGIIVFVIAGLSVLFIRLGRR
ncbi:MAG: hypothetical protein HXY46_00890 [Syntrophaceae bacterium]|nr:hypothetical protein [Syntrophaceae bacterium]